VLHDAQAWGARTLLGRLEQRAAAGRPIGVAVIGGGVFGSLYLAQARRTPGVHVVGVADLAPALRARAAAGRRLAGGRAGRAQRGGGAPGGHDLADRRHGGLIAAPGVEVVIEATGDAPAGVEHALRAIEAGRHVVMVNVEADALVGPLLARRAAAAGVVYSLAYGDQPALICELVEWARVSGFEVVCAGKGTKHLPAYHEVTPATVWQHYGLAPGSDRGPQRADGSARSSTAPSRPSRWPRSRTPRVSCRRRAASASRPAAPASWRDSYGLRATAACSTAAGRSRWSRAVHADGSPCPATCAGACTSRSPQRTASSLPPSPAYGLSTSGDGRVAALWRPSHLVGLELGVSVARAALAGEPTGVARAGIAQVACRAKRDLKAGETIDGEGGEHVYGVFRRVAPGAPQELLPMGLARGARLLRDVARGAAIAQADVEPASTGAAAALHAELVRELRAAAVTPDLPARGGYGRSRQVPVRIRSTGFFATRDRRDFLL